MFEQLKFSRKKVPNDKHIYIHDLFYNEMKIIYSNDNLLIIFNKDYLYKVYF